MRCPLHVLPVTTPVSKKLCISHLFCARTTPSVGTCFRLYFIIIIDRKRLVFQLEDVNSYCLAICGYSDVPRLSTGSLNLIWTQQENFAFISSVVDCVSVNLSARLNHDLRDAQKVCALTILGTALICRINLGCEGLRHRNDFLTELTGEVLFICLSGSKCSHNAGKLHSESSKFQIFVGSMPPNPLVMVQENGLLRLLNF